MAPRPLTDHRPVQPLEYLQPYTRLPADLRRAHRSLRRWRVFALVPVDKRMLTDHAMRRAMRRHLEEQLRDHLARHGATADGTYSAMHLLTDAEVVLRGERAGRLAPWAWYGMEWRP